MLFRVLAAAVCAALFFIKPVLAEEGQCRSLDEIKTMAAAQGMMFAQITERDQIARFSAFYNAIPPESDTAHDTVALLRNERVGVMLLGQNGLICNNTVIPRQHFDRLIGQILGTVS